MGMSFMTPPSYTLASLLSFFKLSFRHPTQKKEGEDGPQNLCKSQDFCSLVVASEPTNRSFPVIHEHEAKRSFSYL